MQYNMKDIFKEIMKENDGYSFQVLNKMFWETVIDASLEITDGHRSNASKMLGVSRVTFKNKIDWCGHERNND